MLPGSTSKDISQMKSNYRFVFIYFDMVPHTGIHSKLNNIYMAWMIQFGNGFGKYFISLEVLQYVICLCKECCVYYLPYEIHETVSC